MKSKKVKAIVSLIFCLCILSMFTITAFAENKDVAGAVTKIWDDSKSQIKSICNNVVFPVCDAILCILFFIKLGMAYLDYRKNGQFEWIGPAILFACLIFMLTAPMYIWTILGF